MEAVFFNHDARPRWFAHRGGAGERPENTLVAFQHAIELGYRYLELDVHLTRDEHWVVLHDPLLERTTDGSGNVADFTLAELRRLDAGYRFGEDAGHPYRARGFAIPTFEEVVKLSETTLFNVEIKPNPVTFARYSRDEIAERFWRFVVERELKERVLIAAAEQELANAVRRVAGQAALHGATKREAWVFLIASKLGLHRNLRPTYRALQVPGKLHGVPIVTRRFVRAAHQCGVEVHAWTIDDVGDAARYLGLGVDGIMTDRPELMRQLFKPGVR